MGDTIAYKKFIQKIFFVVPRLFEEKWRDTVFGFPWGVVRGAWCVVPSF